MRRALWETIVELCDSVTPRGDAASMVRVTGLSVALPVDVALRTSGGEVEVLAEAPRSRWRGGFDERPSRMSLTMSTEDVA
jgi:hypothetical protein